VRDRDTADGAASPGNTDGASVLNLGAHFGFGAIIVECVCGMCAAPIGGALSDRFGRKPVILAALSLLLLLAIPCYQAMAASHSAATVPFERLKSLTGEWQPGLPGYGQITNSIRLVSDGKAIEETIGTPN
jgi:MFS family permease